MWKKSKSVKQLNIDIKTESGNYLYEPGLE